MVVNEDGEWWTVGRWMLPTTACDCLQGTLANSYGPFLPILQPPLQLQ
jgi:hypothetical protein